MTRFVILLCTSLLFPLAAWSQGSGSNASLSLLELDDPLETCLLAGAELYRLEEEDESPEFVIESPTDSLIWSITFDQSIIEIEYQDDYLFVLAEQVEFGPCT